MPRRKAAKSNEEDEASDAELDKILKQTLSEDEKARNRAELKWVDVECPYCGETFEVRVDPSEEGQQMVQDCQVCCKPIELSVETEEGEVEVFAYRG